MNCSVAQALEVLGDWWTLLIIRDAFLGTRRFVDFEASLGVAKNILSARLAHLVEHQIMERVDVGQHGQRFEYRLTARGKDLITVLTALRQWGDRWIYGEGQEPLLICERATGAPIPAVRVTGADGHPVRGGELELRPGPGASEATLARFRARRF